MKNEIKNLEKKTYIAPDIEVVEIQIEQNILTNGSGGGAGLSGTDFDPVDW